MLLKVFSVYDAKAFAYLPPFFMAEKGMAARVFTEAVRDKSHQFGKFPEDYILFQIGSYDDQTGNLMALLAPEQVASGLQVRDRESAEIGKALADLANEEIR